MSIRVVHVITGLGVGGAETMLAKLLEAEQAAGLRRTVEVICLGAGGAMEARIRAAGVSITCIGMGRGGTRGPLSGLRALAMRLRDLRPDVVQCWMYHADLLGGLTAWRVVPRAARIWSIRASSMPHPASLLTRTIIRTCALLSSVLPARIVSCSGAAAALHVLLGYEARRIVVIPNGFDLTRFVPSADARVHLRAELGLAPDAPVIGCVARFDPQKDFPTLFRMFAAVLVERPDASLVIAGRGCSLDNPGITSIIPASCASRIRLLGVRRDIPALTAAFDVAVLTSAYGEGFPNVLGEALACGVPCVATDVGDSREIVGAEGVIAPVGDADALARGVLGVLGRPQERQRALAATMRERALAHYELTAIARRYWAVQDELTPHHAVTA